MADQEAYNLALKKLLDLMARFESFNKLRKNLDEEEAYMRKDWDAWYHIYEREKPPEEQTSLPLEGEAGSDPAIEALAHVPELFELTEPLPSEQPTVAEFGEKFSQRTYGSKTLKVIAVLQDAGEAGVTPKELTEALRRLDVPVSVSFASNALFRLKKQQKVRLVGKHYIWIEDSQSKEAA